MNLHRFGHRQTISIGQAYDLFGRQAAQRLTLWRLRYHLEACGFRRREAEHLLFLRWLAVTRGLIGT